MTNSDRTSSPTFDEDRDELVLSTGTRLYANWGVIGLNHHLQPRQGYDGDIPGADHLTAAERTELADYMLAQWQAYKDAIK